MEKVVNFRPFEERDIDFIFKCKNDASLNKMVVGQCAPFGYEDASMWVHNCMKQDREDLRYWAICTNDEEQRIVGWVSLSEIDLVNKKACYHGLVIGDSEYKDGTAWVETYIFILYQVFEVLGLNRLYGTYYPFHPATKAIADATFFTTEGLYRQSSFKDGEYQDEVIASLLATEYFEHKHNGEYEYISIMKRLIKNIKKGKS